MGSGAYGPAKQKLLPRAGDRDGADQNSAVASEVQPVRLDQVLSLPEIDDVVIGGPPWGRTPPLGRCNGSCRRVSGICTTATAGLHPPLSARIVNVMNPVELDLKSGDCHGQSLRLGRLVQGRHNDVGEPRLGRSRHAWQTRLDVSRRSPPILLDSGAAHILLAICLQRHRNDQHNQFDHNGADVGSPAGREEP